MSNNPRLVPGDDFHHPLFGHAVVTKVENCGNQHGCWQDIAVQILYDEMGRFAPVHHRLDTRYLVIRDEIDSDWVQQPVTATPTSVAQYIYSDVWGG
tara:strand:- start:11631 stop:11921 length:291 start_codon:yes stop_codon:yes gene_type:complete